MRAVEFKIVQIDPSPYFIVAPDTDIGEESLSRGRIKRMLGMLFAMVILEGAGSSWLLHCCETSRGYPLEYKLFTTFNL